MLLFAGSDPLRVLLEASLLFSFLVFVFRSLKPLKTSKDTEIQTKSRVFRVAIAEFRRNGLLVCGLESEPIFLKLRHLRGNIFLMMKQIDE